MSDSGLPIDELRGDFINHWGETPIVMSAPTGSGKSTQVPRWCLERERALSVEQNRSSRPILVIEPRRVACQSLARRVAELESTPLGLGVGYTVRDDDRSSAETMIRFVTTGVALRMWSERRFADYGSVVIDEFHERSLDLDLLLALCQQTPTCPLVVMSATFAAQRVTSYLEGIHLEGRGRLYSVEVSYHPHGNTLPHPHGLIEALSELIEKACETAEEPHKDVLVFLPGKGEINEAKYRLEQLWDRQRVTDCREVIALHGGLSLSDQSRVFSVGMRQRVILATNVAETSLTVPRVGIVIDSGLVRQTRYDRGRGALALSEIAADSAEQRRGRAGRLSEGRCWRMWSRGVNLKPHTTPEIHRESLNTLLLATAACGVELTQLSLLDPPKERALNDAQQVLNGLGAIDEQGTLSSCGRALFSLGIDLTLGRWLIEGLEAGDTDLRDQLIDLVSGLSCSKRLFLSGRPADPNDELRDRGCDAIGVIRAMRIPLREAQRYHLDPLSVREAREHRTRLLRGLQIDHQRRDHEEKINRRSLALALMRADQRSVYVLRERKRQASAWVGLGPEMSLGRETALSLELSESPRHKVEALFALDSHASAKSGRAAEHRVTLSMPLELDWLKQATLGEERLGEATLKRGKLRVEIERVFMKRVLESRSLKPQGKWARQALVRCLLRGQPWSKLSDEVESRLERINLNLALVAMGEWPTHLSHMSTPQLVISTDQAEEWFTARLVELGFEEAEELELLSRDDLLPSSLHPDSLSYLDKVFPRLLNMSDARYMFHYDVLKRRVIMEQVAGSRKEAPRPEWLPQCGGFEIRLKRGQHDSALRARRHSRH